MDEIELKPGQLRIDSFYIFKKSLIKPKTVKPSYLPDDRMTKLEPYEFPPAVSVETKSNSTNTLYWIKCLFIFI